MFKSVVCTFALLAIFSGKASADMSEKSIMTLLLKLFEHGTPCAEEFKLTEEDIHAFKQTQFPEGEHNKCFANCLFSSLSMMKDGQYTPDAALEGAKTILDNEEDYELFSGYLKSCSAVNDEEVSDGEKGCDRAYLILNCLKENAPQYGFKFNN